MTKFLKTFSTRKTYFCSILISLGCYWSQKSQWGSFPHLPLIKMCNFDMYRCNCYSSTDNLMSGCFILCRVQRWLKILKIWRVTQYVSGSLWLLQGRRSKTGSKASFVVMWMKMVSMCTRKELGRCVNVSLSWRGSSESSYPLCLRPANKESLVVDYNFLANEQHAQVLAFFLPEAPTEMLKIFDEVHGGMCSVSYYACKLKIFKYQGETTIKFTM